MGEQLLVLRIMRLMRLVRALRMLENFKNLWKLVQGLMKSIGTICSSFLLVTILLYVFACIGIEIITKNESLRDTPELEDIIDSSFSSLPTLMLSLMQFITLDPVASYYLPLVYREPFLLFYFVPIILIVSISLMNMVTAVLVEDAIEVSRCDKDFEQMLLRKKLKRLIPEIRNVFRQLDTSEDGCI